MDWTFPTDAMLGQAASGIGTILERLQEEIGRSVRGARFLYDGHDMMEITRTIENLVGSDDQLFVGFQRLEKFRAESSRYASIAKRGTRITAFAEGSDRGAPHSLPMDRFGVRWIETESGRRRLENQWFLVVTGSRKLAFVGYDISRPGRIATGGATSPERLFTGFVTEDAAVVDSLAETLSAVAEDSSPKVATSDLLVRMWRGARLVLAMTDDGSEPAYERVRRSAAEFASRIDADLLLYDRSSESYLVDPYPYPDVVGWEKRLTREDVFRLQRKYLADQIDDATTLGVNTSAWLPRHPGPRGLPEAIDRFDVDVVLVPEELGNPSLIDRIRGNSLERFVANAGVPVLVVTSRGALVEEDWENKRAHA